MFFRFKNPVERNGPQNLDDPHPWFLGDEPSHSHFNRSLDYLMNVVKSLQDSKPKIPIRHWLLCLSLLALAAIVCFADAEISQWLTAKHLPSDVKKAIHLSEAFAHGAGVAVILLAVAVLAVEAREKIGRLILCPIVAGLTANIIKMTIARYRPLHFYQIAAQEGPDVPLPVSTTFVDWLPFLNADIAGKHVTQSFPSGHTTTAFALAVGLSWMFPKGRFLFYGLAIAAGLQRIVSQSHWPSDVLIGAAIGLLTASMICYSRLGNRLFRRIEGRKEVEVTSEVV